MVNDSNNFDDGPIIVLVYFPNDDPLYVPELVLTSSIGGNVANAKDTFC